MFSNSCKYGLRAVIYIASQPKAVGKTGIKQISKDLYLPTPFLAKILQQLAKQKILSSTKGPHGGFSLMKDPKKITLLDIVKIIDGDEIFTNCIVHNSTCKNVDKHKETCPLHDDYEKIRTDLVKMFAGTTIDDLVAKPDKGKKFMI
ncbi:MAG: Rrf2 family transcriptional regulator, iron-sulfur cluster assembly transcription factor [Bacteroidota bacterium]|nr:Rrf2 family transcriptional regulator, iron-sulfur cluster assembly transcription factor [Bacteroidota bacterium]